jgi:hypothetical protein
MNLATGADGLIELADLKPFGQVWVKIVFSRKLTLGVNRTTQGEAGANSQPNRPGVEDRQRAWVAHTYRTNIRVRWLALTHRASTKQLALGLELTMNLEPDGRNQ